jgi:hypothetical protein
LSEVKTTNPKKCVTGVDIEIIMKRTTDKRLQKSQERRESLLYPTMAMEKR